MKITRELTVNKINVICYDPENKCEITKELVLIGNLTDDQISKEIKKRNFGIVIDWERNEEETKIYGMDAETFLMDWQCCPTSRGFRRILSGTVIGPEQQLTAPVHNFFHRVLPYLHRRHNQKDIHL